MCVFYKSITINRSREALGQMNDEPRIIRIRFCTTNCQTNFVHKSLHAYIFSTKHLLDIRLYELSSTKLKFGPDL